MLSETFFTESAESDEIVFTVSLVFSVVDSTKLEANIINQIDDVVSMKAHNKSACGRIRGLFRLNRSDSND